VRLVILLVAGALVFASCASGPTPEGGGQQPALRRPANSKQQQPAPGQIPVEKRATVKFADGTLDEYTISEYDPSDITLLGQNRFSASGGLMDQVEFTYHEDKGVVTAKMTKDDENRLKSRVVYQYNDDDLLVKETVVNKAGKPVSTNEYSYDNNGKIVARGILNGAGTKLAETVYTYNNNKVISSETKDSQGKRISSSKNEYDPEGNLVNQTLYNAAGSVTRKIATVWENGREMQNEQTSADGKVQLRISNEYGTTGELLKKVIENFQGDSVQVMEFEYEFRPDRGRT
jgi:hypothetical protein